MSNNSNLSALAAALDDGTSGQVLQSTGSGGVAFADASSGVTIHNTQAAMLTDAASADEGTLHYETDNNRLYVKQSSGFYLLASITNASPTIDSFSENTGGAGANNLTAGGTFTLTAGSNTVVTINATEPDLETISYSATVTSGTATDVFSSPSFPVTNQSSNVFTLTPVTSGTGGTVTIRFDASDGTNVANVSHSFEIAFVIADSHYTTLLMATDGSAGDNQDDITDSSSSSHPITVAGDAHAGTFSPYRHGGYSTYFDGNDYLSIAHSTDLDLGTDDFTIEGWWRFDDTSNQNLVSKYAANAGFVVQYQSGNLRLVLGLGGSDAVYSFSWTPVAGTWYHVCILRDGTNGKAFINGTQIGSTTTVTTSNVGTTGTLQIGLTHTVSEYTRGYVSDVRIVKGTAITPASGGPTERLTAVTNTKLLTCHLPYISDGSSSGHTITVNGNPSTKPLGPYDHNEYSKSDNGGSVYFDGSGDYLTYSAGNEIGFSTGDFTAEFWAYNKFSTGSLQKIIETRTASNWIIQIASTNDFQWYNGSTSVFNYNISYTKNTWAHFVVTRDGTTLRLFVNGRLVSTATDSVSYSVSSGTVYISRRYNDSLDYFSGYLTDLRVVKGSVVTEYQTSSTTTGTQIFTPPTAPLTAITDTSLLLSGTDAHVIDKSQNYNLKLFNDAASTAALTSNSTPPYIGAAWANTSAVSFDGVDDYIDLGTAAIPTPYNEDYTFEFWMYPTSLSRRQSPIAQYAINQAGRMILFLETNGSIQFEQKGGSITNNGIITSSSGLISINNWYHVAVSNSNGGTRSLYVDGIRSGTISNTQDMYNGNTTIGMTPSQAYDFTGYIQDLRITKGLARYTAADESSNIPSAPLKG